MSKKDKIFEDKNKNFFLINFSEIKREKISEIIKFVMRKGVMTTGDPYCPNTCKYTLNLSAVESPVIELTSKYKGDTNAHGEKYNDDYKNVVNDIYRDLAHKGLTITHPALKTNIIIPMIFVDCYPVHCINEVGDNNFATKCALKFVVFSVNDDIGENKECVVKRYSDTSYTKANDDLCWFSDEDLYLDAVYDFVMNNMHNDSFKTVCPYASAPRNIDNVIHNY